MRTHYHFHTYSEEVFFCGSFEVVQQTGYYPYGEPWTEPDGDNSYFFGGKERVALGGLGWSDFGPRLFSSPTGYWCSPDSKSESFYDVSPYIYCGGNPIMFSDPSGMSPVYSSNGDSIGCTKEGFTGMVLIYFGDKEINVSDYTEEELRAKYAGDIEDFDFARNHNGLLVTQDNMSKIITSVISHFEGTEISGHIFSMSEIAEEAIEYSVALEDNWLTSFSESNAVKPKITLGIGGGYKSTVENLASSFFVHEWYSHAIMHVCDEKKNHSIAYLNVIKNNSFWNKTTLDYKYFNYKSFLIYYINELSYYINELSSNLK